MNKQILFILTLFLFVCPASALTITPVGDTHVVLQPGTVHTFEFASDDPITGSTFYLDGVPTSDGDKTHDYLFSEQGSYYNVSVTAQDITGNSNTITFNVVTERTITTTKAELFDESGYNSIMSHIQDEDYEGLMADSTVPFTDLVGRLFYIALFLLPFGLMWQKQQRLTIPVVLGLTLGTLLIAFIPETWKQFIVVAIATSYAVNLYMLTRER